MLTFIAPDQDMMTNLKQAFRLHIAWKSIKADSEDLNLDAAQNRETDNNLHRANKTVDDRIDEAYCWLIVPYRCSPHLTSPSSILSSWIMPKLFS